MEPKSQTEEIDGKKIENTTYKLLFWNILCDQYSYDWKTAPKIELKYKVWDYREKLFKKIFSLEKTFSDIYCFVEVDKEHEIFNMINKIFNNTNDESLNIFQCLYFPRPNTPLGILLLFNTKKFKILYFTKFYLGKNANQNFALFAIFQELSYPNNIFAVLITHLIAWDKNEYIRIQQVNKLFWNLNNDKYILKFGINKIFICGDFNTMPDSQCIQLMKINNFNSVFNNFSPNDDNFTIVIDTLDEGLKKLKFDYIFTTPNINIVNKYMATEYLNFQVGLPNEDFPSDHIFLQAEFYFNPN